MLNTLKKRCLDNSVLPNNRSLRLCTHRPIVEQLKKRLNYLGYQITYKTKQHLEVDNAQQ